MGRRYRLYPTLGQTERLTGWGHTCRAVWNVALAQRQFVYGQRGTRLRAAGQCRDLTEARAELDWLANLPAQSGQQILAHLDRAYDNWWDPKHPAGPPRFKKRRNELAVPFPGQAVAVRKLNNRWAEVRLPKLGWVPFRLSRPLGGVVRNATVSRDALGWHVAFRRSDRRQAGTTERPAGVRGGLRHRLLSVRLDGDSTATDAPDPDRGGTAAPAWSGTPQGPAGPLGKTLQPRALFGPAAPHYCGDRPAPGAAGAPPGRLHPQAHHRPRSTPRLGRDRGPAGDGHDSQRQGHLRAAWEKREGQGRTQPGRFGQHPGRAASPTRLQGTTVRVGAVAGAASGHFADVREMWPPGPGVPARVRATVRLHGLRAPSARRRQRRTEHRTARRRAGGRQHAQSPSGGEARKEPHA